MRGRLRRARNTILAALATTLVAGHAAADGPPTLLLLTPEIDGDIPGGEAAWADRLALLGRAVSDAVDEAGTYAMAGEADAPDAFAKNARRAAIYDCPPCAIEAAEEAGAERTLSLRVFRMSALILTLHAILRDGETGNIRFATAHGFRGDTDDTWLHAARTLIRKIEAIPPELR